LTNQRAVLMGSVGETGRDTDQAAYYNSAMWLDGTVDMRNPPRYDKNHLLPMGERIPFGFKWLIDAMQIPLGGYEAGNGFTPFVLNTPTGPVRVSTNICYENEFGEDLIKAWKNGDDNAPNVWVNMTNLGWFGMHNVSTNQAQHLHMSRARAMEMARPMLVVTNTGTSANIDAMGDVIDILPADQAVVRDVMVQPRSGLTPYIALGNAPLWALLSIVIGVAIVRRHRHVDI
jgi:apolipoprotein N-acyltransferase